MFLLKDYKTSRFQSILQMPLTLQATILRSNSVSLAYRMLGTLAYSPGLILVPAISSMPSFQVSSIALHPQIPIVVTARMAERA